MSMKNGNFFKILYIKAALYFTDCLIYYLDLLIIIVKKDIFQVSALINLKTSTLSKRSNLENRVFCFYFSFFELSKRM